MHSAPRPLDVEVSEELASHRHRPAVAEMFPLPAEGAAEGGYEAREAAYLRILLAEPLRQFARESSDEDTRAIADGALGGHESGRDAFVDYARLEDALARIVDTTSDDAARAVAQDALALYQGR